MRRRSAVLAIVVLAGVLVWPAAAGAAPAEQWPLATLRIPEAHAVSTGAGVTVAVIDSGVSRHTDLEGQIVAGKDFTETDAALQDPTRDLNGHGTAMAGLIAAKGPAPGHALGIAPGAKVMPIKVRAEGFGRSDDLDDAIRWAVDNGAKVISMSLGIVGGDPDEELAVKYALDHEVVLVASSGNKDPQVPGQDGVMYPARYPGVLAVGSVDRDGSLWANSLTGPQVGLTAPGAGMPVLYKVEPYASAGRYSSAEASTSTATAIVAGAAALVRSKYPQLGANDVLQRLVTTADDAGAPGRDPQYGYGRVNVVKALTADVAPAAANPVGAQAGPAAEPADDSGASDLTALLVGGAVVAGLVVVVGVGLVIFLLLRGRRRPSVRR